MQETIFEKEHYKVRLFPEETARQYAFLPDYTGNDIGRNLFRACLPKAKKEALDFLKGLGILPEKLFLARPLVDSEENGEVLFLCSARVCGEVLKGGELFPRQSVEEAGLSLVWVADKKSFSPALVSLGENEVELRFVISLPFDPAFFESFGR